MLCLRPRLSPARSNGLSRALRSFLRIKFFSPSFSAKESSLTAQSGEVVFQTVPLPNFGPIARRNNGNAFAKKLPEPHGTRADGVASTGGMGFTGKECFAGL